MAQDGSSVPIELLPEPVLPRDFSLRWDRPCSDFGAGNRPGPVRLFAMPSAIPLAPLGLETDEDTERLSDADMSSLNDARMQVVLGANNPYFDFRRRGDPGGVGYYKLYSQVLLFDTSTTAMSVGLHALTPAGLEADGIATGPTYVCPNFAWLCDLGDGAALHGFVGQNLRAAAHWDNQLARSLQYGIALQSPCLGQERDRNCGVHLFVEALGRYRYEGITAQRPAHNWELLPGLEWRVNRSWWISGGYLFPMGTSGIENHRVQVNFTWRF